MKSVVRAKEAGGLEATWRDKKEGAQHKGWGLSRGFCYFYKDIEAGICILEMLLFFHKYVLSSKYLTCFLLKLSWP